ncbi:MAG: hypothetical protein H6779_03855 [Candidatus Nomurabacteria bacterium]|nr:MAG: hypothetical protein H6779_03855 [Candidatus Nomurabacteria bacterium]
MTAYQMGFSYFLFFQDKPMYKRIFICVHVIFLFIYGTQNVVAKTEPRDIGNSNASLTILENNENLTLPDLGQSRTRFPLAVSGNVTNQTIFNWFDDTDEFIDNSRVMMNFRYGNLRQNINLTGRYTNNSDFMTKTVSYQYPLNSLFSLHGNLRRANNDEYGSFGFGMRINPVLRLTSQVTARLADPDLVKGSVKVSIRF